MSTLLHCQDNVTTNDKGLGLKVKVQVEDRVSELFYREWVCIMCVFLMKPYIE